MQIWNQVTETTNTWSDIANQLYVLSGYWVDGYTVDNENQWTAVSQTSNSWTNIST